MVVGGLYGAENRGACWAAEFRERVGYGRQGGRTQLVFFLQAPAEGDTHTHVHCALTSERLTVVKDGAHGLWWSKKF